MLFVLELKGATFFLEGTFFFGQCKLRLLELPLLINLLNGQGPLVGAKFYYLRIAQPVCIEVPVVTE